MEIYFSHGWESAIEHSTKISVQALRACRVLFLTLSPDHAHCKMRIAIFADKPLNASR